MCFNQIRTHSLETRIIGTESEADDARLRVKQQKIYLTCENLSKNKLP